MIYIDKISAQIESGEKRCSIVVRWYRDINPLINKNILTVEMKVLN